MVGFPEGDGSRTGVLLPSSVQLLQDWLLAGPCMPEPPLC